MTPLFAFSFADFFTHAPRVFDVIFSLHAAAIMIVNLTPTPADDAAVASFYKVVEVLAGIFSKRAKQ